MNFLITKFVMAIVHIQENSIPCGETPCCFHSGKLIPQGIKALQALFRNELFTGYVIVVYKTWKVQRIGN